MGIAQKGGGDQGLVNRKGDPGAHVSQPVFSSENI